MVDAHLPVAGAGERRHDLGEEGELGRRIGKEVGVDASLMGSHPGDMGIGIHGEPVGTEIDDSVQSAAERRLILAGQPVDEVEVDRGESEPPCLPVQGHGLLLSLIPSDHRLDVGIEILHSERKAIEPGVGQHLQVVSGGDPWVDLDGELRIVGQVETGCELAVDPRQSVGGMVSRSASTPVVLNDRTCPSQRVGHQLRLGYQPS